MHRSQHFMRDDGKSTLTLERILINKREKTSKCLKKGSNTEKPRERFLNWMIHSPKSTRFDLTNISPS